MAQPSKPDPWAAVRTVTTLKEAHEAIEKLMLAPDAARSRWRTFYLRSAEVYRQVAEIDRGHHHGTLYWANREREKGKAIDAKSKRPVTLPPFLGEEIERHLDAFVENDQDAWVFVGSKGGRPKRNNFWHIWNAARQAARMSDVHLHDLRHTGNTLAGPTLRELMDRMGHSSTRAALIYLHSREERAGHRGGD